MTKIRKLLVAATVVVATAGISAPAFAGYYQTVCNAYSCWNVYVRTVHCYSDGCFYQ
jgi:hypothetical protein